MNRIKYFHNLLMNTSLFKGQFALSRIVNCNDIYKIVKKSGTNRLSPRDVFKKMCEEGYLDNVD